MRSQWKRLALAALLSLSCATATVVWYKTTEKKLNLTNEAPLAQVSRVGDEVLRRPATRLLWQAVNTGDSLYNGETVRTSTQGELRIQFEDGRYIDLEPDSLIVLQKSKGEISLDLMEGSLFVNAKAADAPGADAAAAPGLVLNSKNGKVDLTGASASLSKGSGDRLDLQVLEGSAKLRGADGKEKEIGSGKSSSLSATGLQFDNSNWKILSPSAGKPVFIDPDHDKAVSFRWQGLPPAWTVSLLTGATRKDLRESGAADKAGATELQAKLPLGKFWWKLVAKNPENQQVMAETPVTRLNIQARYAPAVVFPLADAEIQMDKSPFDMSFKWQRSEDASRVQLEVSTSATLEKPLVNRTFTKEDQLSLPNLKEGAYYWRMSAFYDGEEKPVAGKVQRFTLLKSLPVKKDPAQILWSLPEDKLSQSFTTQPALELSWNAATRQEDIASYRVRLSDEADALAEPRQFEAKEGRFKAPVPKAGRYVASIEALDKDGAVIGKSDLKTLAVNELPRLKPPVLLPEEGLLEAGGDGRTELRWQPLPGAKEYQLVITNKAGKELARKKYTGSSASLKNLMPGEYNVKLDAVDSWGRESLESSPRALRVPDKSSLKAPTLKKIKVN
ncbi:MAG: FecR domain-containing protein [Bdellovibrionaceae bacterium]|nr:FecR domain-containing protein [Pseudobdellovibrionaceae bacterium]MBX3033135.1 FecR domain-containing protein [Pseudobdellovibrionaceae bacterium]